MQSSAPNNLVLNSIAPALGAKFSPNLYAYLRSPSHRSLRHFGTVFQDSRGVQWLGFWMSGDFIGVRLIEVLCNGLRARLGVQMLLLNGLVELENFWERYRTVGRCAIDPEHGLHFAGDDNRWSVKADKRTCVWCGDATQTMRRWTEPVERSEWA